MLIKAISLWQPWATAMALHLKLHETRGYATKHRGPLAIHAAQKKSAAQREIFNDLMVSDQFRKTLAAAGYQKFADLPLGAVVAVGEMCGCQPVERMAAEGVPVLERALGDYAPGRFAWLFQEMTALATPWPVTGRQGFFFVEIPLHLIPRR